MKNVLVLGSGRSGTSLTAGLLAKSGYFMGDDLIPAREANPKGFFEDREVNRINEQILTHHAPAPSFIAERFFAGCWLFKNRLKTPHRWLARLSLETEIVAGADEVEAIRRLVERSPYCFKDPRFCYTLSAWRPHLHDAVFLCVFRHPLATAHSMVKEVKQMPRLGYLRFGLSEALEVWRCMYRHVLRRHQKRGNWLFLHFEQLFTRYGLNEVERFVEAPVDRTFPDRSLVRSRPKNEDVRMCSVTKSLYRELCGLADSDPGSSS